MKDLIAQVTVCEMLNKDFARITIDAPEIAETCKPGQFVHIRCGQGVYSLMRRPISVYQVKDKTLVLLFQIKGEGTKWLSRRRPGDFVDLIGPLGQGFTLPEKGPVWAVAGGIGIAPLCFLVQEIRQKNIPLVMFFGARSKDSLCLIEEIKNWGVDIRIATEDGSAGVRGFVTELFEKSLYASKPEAIYACGPESMLKTVVNLAKDLGVESQVSLEERMACGLGACRGCVTMIQRNGKLIYENVCSSGPVFLGREVVFDE
ncbi:MAG: dihydroorotate dehydrogenase electron transfer subunit [Bacillota bacterium]|jgi:dihydroorotate dehydrogenase electron transfer subunit